MAKNKRQKGKVVEIPAPVAAPALAERPAVQPAPSPEPVDRVPTYTLRADRRFDLLAMLAIRELARADAPERYAEIEIIMRQFELYEERYMR